MFRCGVEEGEVERVGFKGLGMWICRTYMAYTDCTRLEYVAMLFTAIFTMQVLSSTIARLPMSLWRQPSETLMFVVAHTLICLTPLASRG